MPTLEEKQSRISDGNWIVERLGPTPSGRESLYVRSDIIEDGSGLMAEIQTDFGKITPEDLANAELMASSKRILQIAQILAEAADAALGALNAANIEGDKARALSRALSDFHSFQRSIWSD